MPPDILKNNNKKIFIAAAQHYDEIYKNISNIWGFGNALFEL